MDDNELAIRQRAYALWEMDGRPHDRAASHWAQAQAELKSEEETQLASDAQADGIPGGDLQGVNSINAAQPGKPAK